MKIRNKCELLMFFFFLYFDERETDVFHKRRPDVSHVSDSSCFCFFYLFRVGH